MSEPEQQPLFSDEDQLILSGSDRAAGNFDLSRCKHSQQRIEEMLRARAEGLSVRACARAFGMSEHTVLALEERLAGDVATHKQSMAQEFRQLARLSVSRMIEEIHEMPKTALPMIAGIATDKMQNLEGEPSMIVDHRSSVHGEREDLNSMIAALPAADAEVLEAETGEPIAAEDARHKKGGEPEAGKEDK